MQSEDFTALASSRHSTRDFRPDPIPQQVLDEIFADARHAPSWSNTRGFMIALASGELADRLRKAYCEVFDRSLPAQHKDVAGAVKLVATGGLPDGDFPVLAPYPSELKEHSVAVGRALYGHLGIERSDRDGRDAQNRRNFEAFGAPTIGLVFIHKGFLPFSALDAGLMLQTVFLSAKAHGVDSCPLGVLATWRRPAERIFDIPADYKLITGFALGYASEHQINDFRAERRPVRFMPVKD